MTKTNQSQLVDMPTIGVDTIVQAHAANLAGIAIEANAVQVIDTTAVLKRADDLGLFVYVF
jgi:hypothetical protein